MVKNLSINKTKCSLYFKEQKEIVLGNDIKPVESGDGLYAVTHDDLEELGQEWNQTEYRYAGVDPDNYVEFNNEIWRIIGLVNVKTNSGVEQRLKIVRQDGVNNQKKIGVYVWDKSNNNWTTSTLKDMLNGIYYKSSTGECYNNGGGFIDECDFNTGIDLPKGLDDAARNMIDKEVIWSLGGWIDSEITAKQFYEKERGTITGNNNEYPSEWSNETDVGEKHNGIGLIYPSDYGYAVGGDVRNSCLSEELCNYDGGNCKTNDWLYASKEYVWTFFPTSDSSGGAYFVDSSGGIYDDGVDCADDVWPTAYLTTTTKIVDGTGDINSPFVLSIQ